MLKTFIPPENSNFIGRELERKKLKEISTREESSLVIVYGRRRVGKTELIEQSFRERNLLKFEGVENKDEEFQKKTFLRKLAESSGEISYIDLSPTITWSEIFTLLAKHTKKGVWTIYFEELQWMACYQEDLISELKTIWDNEFRYNKNLILVLCGSSPSFFVTKVLRSKALYNRSIDEFRIEEFPINQITGFVKNRSVKELFNHYLLVGGIPQYLKLLAKESSAYLGISKNSFLPNSFFLNEFEKILISSFARSLVYRKIIMFLALNKYANRSEILKDLEFDVSSGGVTERIIDLVNTGFVEKYSPVNLEKPSSLIRYAIRDPFLHFYFKFIHLNKTQIENGDFIDNPLKLISHADYSSFLGFSFERFVRRSSRKIARILEFSGVAYKAGAFFSRKAGSSFQIDLMFQRKDKVWTICEIKYKDAPIDVGIIGELEGKISKLILPKGVSIQKVLVSASPISKELEITHYFDRVIGLDELLTD